MQIGSRSVFLKMQGWVPISDYRGTAERDYPEIALAYAFGLDDVRADD